MARRVPDNDLPGHRAEETAASLCTGQTGRARDGIAGMAGGPLAGRLSCGKEAERDCEGENFKSTEATMGEETAGTSIPTDTAIRIEKSFYHSYLSIRLSGGRKFLAFAFRDSRKTLVLWVKASSE